MRRKVWMALLAAGLSLSAATAEACPSCKAANETDSARPRAYMYSILFMIGVPFTMAAGFGIGFYRMNKRYQESLAARYTDAVQIPDTDE